MICSIYKIVNRINGKVYIGQTWNTIKQRWFDHKKPSGKRCVKLHRAITKYGAQNFTLELITVCGIQETADYWEKFFISKFESINTGYNIKEGGSHGRLSEEQKRAVGDFHRGKTMSEDSINKISKSLRKLNDEQIIRIQSDNRTARVLAELYGVSRETIFRIKKKSLRCYRQAA
jgi:group I intron endonuclease